MEGSFEMRNIDRGVVDKEENNEDRQVLYEKHLLSPAHARRIYEDHVRTCEHIHDIAQHDDVFCYQYFNKVHATIFANLSAEERAKHIGHRILMRTTIGDQETQPFIYDERDQMVIEDVFTPALQATSKEDMENILNRLRVRLGAAEENVQ